MTVICHHSCDLFDLQVDLEDLSSELKSADDKAKKSVLEVGRLNEDIRREQERVRSAHARVLRY